MEQVAPLATAMAVIPAVLATEGKRGISVLMAWKRAPSLIFITTDFFNVLEILLVEGQVIVLKSILDYPFHVSEPLGFRLNML
jgi:hypothetical protein